MLKVAATAPSAVTEYNDAANKIRQAQIAYNSNDFNKAIYDGNTAIVSGAVALADNDPVKAYTNAIGENDYETAYMIQKSYPTVQFPGADSQPSPAKSMTHQRYLNSVATVYPNTQQQAQATQPAQPVGNTAGQNSVVSTDNWKANPGDTKPKEQIEAEMFGTTTMQPAQQPATPAVNNAARPAQSTNSTSSALRGSLDTLNKALATHQAVQARRPSTPAPQQQPAQNYRAQQHGRYVNVGNSYYKTTGSGNLKPVSEGEFRRFVRTPQQSVQSQPRAAQPSQPAPQQIGNYRNIGGQYYRSTGSGALAPASKGDFNHAANERRYTSTPTRTHWRRPY